MVDLSGEIVLNMPYGGVHFSDKDDPAAIEFVDTINEIYRLAKEGKMYVKFIDGDRKGSIARFEIDETYRHVPCNIRISSYTIGETKFYVGDYIIPGVCRWNKRSNKVKIKSYDRDIIFLPNYEGETVYCLFDAKSKKKELLENVHEVDINNQKLNIGDKVLYINIRYGSGAELCHGVVKEFTATVDSRSHTIYTNIEEEGTGILSTILYPERMIWKKP